MPRSNPLRKTLGRVLSSLGLTQAVVLFAALSAILVGSTSVTALIEQRFRETAGNALETVLEGTDRAIRVWARDQRRAALAFAQSTNVTTAVDSLLAADPDRASLLASDGLRRLREQFNVHLETGQYSGFFIIGPDNLSLASSRDANVGSTNLLIEQPDVLEKLWAGETALSRIQATDIPLRGAVPLYRQETMFVGAPVRDARGQIVALLTLRIDPHEVLFPLLNQGRIGDTGTTYAFDRQGYLLSWTRLEPRLRALGLLGSAQAGLGDDSQQTRLKPPRVRITDPGVDLRTRKEAAVRPQDRPLTRMAASAIRGRRGIDMDGYRDYRGVPVVGVWLWDEALDIGLATEQDVAETYGLFSFVRLLIYGGVGVTALIVMALATVFVWGRRQVQETRNRLKAVFDSAVDGILIIDRNGCIEDVNPAIETMFGYPAAVMRGRNVKMLMTEMDAWGHDGYLERYRKTGEARVIGTGREGEGRRADGSLFPIELSVNRLELESGLRFAGVIRDVSERKQAQRLLQEAEERGRLILESAGEGIYGLDARGITSFINPAAGQILGYVPDELIGRSMHAAVHNVRPDGSPYPLEECPMYEAFTHGKAHWSATEVLWHKDGRPVPIEYTTTPIKKGGRLAGAVVTFRDITERKLLEEQLETALATAERERDAATEANRVMALTRAALDRTGIAEFWVGAGDGRVTLVSDRACDHLGYGREELLGMRVADFDPSLSGDRFVQRMQPIRERGWGRLETIHQTRDGRRLPVEITAMYKPAERDGEDIFIAFVTDITQRKEAEVQLIQAREEAEEANRAKSTFLATMSHEIRTPLNGVVGTLDMLEHTNLQPDQQDLASTAKESARMLQDVIDDVLDFSKIEAGRLELESVPLSMETLLETLGQNLSHLAAKQDVELLIYCDPRLPQVKGDPVRLNQILLNLAGNAIKFTSDLSGRSGRVLVCVEMLQQMNGRVGIALRVEDNGIGMSEAVRERLFQPFVQGEGETTRRFGGTGLGLVITQRLVELMGGRVEVRSELGQGSTFAVRLALDSVQGPPEERRSDLAGIRVLLIEDESESTRILEDYLQHAGAEVMPVRPSRALAACRELCSTTAEALVVIDNHGDTSVSTPVRELLRIAAGDPHPHFVLIERGRRRDPLTDKEDRVSLDLNAMRRRTLINAVAVAAGRESPERSGVSDLGFTLSEPVSVDEVRASGRLILLADDNETNRKVIGQQLRMLGYGVVFAEDGRQALAKWRADDFNLLLTDCHMPLMDGYQLSRRIRELEKDGERAPIVAISADAMKGTAQKCFAAGMDDYVTKPIQLHELQSVLEKWLKAGVRADVAKAPVEEAVPAPAEALDPKVLGELLGTQDPEVLADFYDDFLRTGSQTAGLIQAAYSGSDIAELGRLAHQLKSSARTVGANGLADSCQRLEEAAKGGDSACVAQEMDRFSSLFQQVGQWIEHNHMQAE